MRKVLFLMFLLLLMGLGAASVKAQVRIGGNGQPHTAAVLDLNVDNTDAGNKGALALPRISLGALSGASANLNGVAPIKGMLVYNTNATLGAGLYYWSGDSSKWVKVINSDFTVPLSKIETSIADSGYFLMSNGAGVVPMYMYTPKSSPLTTTSSSIGQVSMVKVLDWSPPPFTIPRNSSLEFSVPGLTGYATCHETSYQDHAILIAGPNVLRIFSIFGIPETWVAPHIVCYSPSY